MSSTYNHTYPYGPFGPSPRPRITQEEYISMSQPAVSIPFDQINNPTFRLLNQPDHPYFHDDFIDCFLCPPETELPPDSFFIPYQNDDNSFINAFYRCSIDGINFLYKRQCLYVNIYYYSSDNWDAVSSVLVTSVNISYQFLINNGIYF